MLIAGLNIFSIFIYLSLGLTALFALALLGLFIKDAVSGKLW